jgi:hypothetical protein
MDIAAPPETVWRVLTDFSHYTEKSESSRFFEGPWAGKRL